AHVLVGERRFLGDAAHRRAADEDAAARELFHDVAAAPRPLRLMSAHRSARAVARRAERQRVGFARAAEHVRRGAHRAADEHRLTDASELRRKVRVPGPEGARRTLAVNVKLLLLAVDDVALNL